MEEKDIMIHIDNVSKVYRLGEIGGTTLVETFQRLRAKLFRKEDPTKIIGAKNYNKGEKFNALDRITLTIKKGERVGIIGHNGAGKSTLLKLICRVTAPSNGEIGLNGRITSMLEVGTGFHPELTGRENIYMNGAILGMTKKEIDAVINDIIEFSEVKEFIDTPVKRYSSGMYVKLAFSVSAHLKSEIMIMDEVLAVGDMQFQNKCINKMMKTSKEEGRTILYVSHNMKTIRELCNRAVVLDHGKIIYDGDVETGIRKYIGEGLIESLPSYYSFVDVKRDFEFGKYVFINSLNFNQKEQAIFENEMHVIVSIDFLAKLQIDNGFIIVAFNDFNRNRIGAVVTDSFSIYEGRNILDFELDISQLCEGDYLLMVEIGSKGLNGGYVIYDNPGIYIPVKIIRKTHNSILWEEKYWGRVLFKNSSVINSKHL